MLSPTQRSLMIDYLMQVTNYSKASLDNKNTNALFNMYNRIKKCMEDYPEDIIHYQMQIGEVPYDEEYLSELNYHDLSNIRNSLKSKCKSVGKKTKCSNISCNVTHDEPLVMSPDELYISYGIDCDDYTANELFAMGYVIVDTDQNSYKTSVKDELRNEIITVINKVSPSMDCDSKSLEELIIIYNDIKSKKKPFADELEEQIRLEKRYIHE